MKLAILLLTVTGCAGFTFMPTTAGIVAGRSALGMSNLEELEETAPPAPPPPATPPTSSVLVSVPVGKEQVEFTAGAIGGIIGFSLGGPIVGASGAVAANYIAKKNNDASEVIQTVSKGSLGVYNYAADLDQKYSLVGKTKNLITGAWDKFKNIESVDPDSLEKFEGTISEAKNKVISLNDEYDLVGGSVSVLGAVGDVLEKAINKADEVNKEYKLSDKAITAVNEAIDSVKQR